MLAKQIWTWYASPIAVVYGKRVEDPNQFDASFAEAFACYLAWQLCERITNSNVKKQGLQQEYAESMAQARFVQVDRECAVDIIPDDTWNLSRIAC